MLEEVREFSFEEAKLLKCKCTVFLTVPTPLIDYSDLSVDESAILAVVGYDGKQVGAVSFRREGDEVVADLEIEYSSPERLDIETGQVYLKTLWEFWDEGGVSVGMDVISVEGITPYYAELTLLKPFADCTPIVPAK